MSIQYIGMENRNRNMYLILLVTLAIIKCDKNSVLSQIDSKSQQKKGFVAEKSEILQQLQTQKNTYDQYLNSQAQAHSSALNAYASYFNEQKRCEGLRGKLQFLGLFSKLPQDFCLVAPIDGQAYRVFIQTLQYQYKSGQTNLVSRIVQQQTDFNADVFAELAAYTRLRQIAIIPLNAAVKAYQQCMKQNSSPSNQHPQVCDPLQKKIAQKEALYGFYRGTQVQFGMSTKTPVFTLQSKQKTLTDLQNDENDFNAQLQPKITQLKSLQQSCFQGIQNYQNLANTRLQAALSSSNDVYEKKLIVQNLYSVIDNFITKVKSVTIEIQSLAAQLKTFFV